MPKQGKKKVQQKQRRLGQQIKKLENKISISKKQNIKNVKPKINIQKNYVVIKHKELIQYDVFLNKTFKQPSRNYFINPANTQMFPWLSRLSTLYEKYHFQSLKFHYVPFCSTLTQGTIIMAVDYDATDEPPASQSHMSQFEETKQTNIYSTCVFTSSKKNLAKGLGQGNYLMISPDVNVSNKDLNTMHLGNFYAVALNGVNIDPVRTGDIWVEYEVHLQTPTLSPQNEYFTLGNGQMQLTYNNNSSLNYAAPFGTTLNYQEFAVKRGLFQRDLFSYTGNNITGSEFISNGVGSHRIIVKMVTDSAYPTLVGTSIVNNSGALIVEYQHDIKYRNGIYYVYQIEFFAKFAQTDAFYVKVETLGSATSLSSWIEVYAVDLNWPTKCPY